MQCRAKAILIIAFLGLSWTLPARATLIVYDYVAEGPGALGTGTVTGRFGFDDSVVDTEPFAGYGYYPASGFIAGIITGGPQDGSSFLLTGVDWTVRNFPTVLDQLVTAFSPVFVRLIDNEVTAFNDDSLPTALTLTDFEFRDLSVSGLQNAPGTFLYTLTSIERCVADDCSPQVPLVPVPVPTTLALVGIAMLAAGLARRRRDFETRVPLA